MPVELPIHFVVVGRGMDDQRLQKIIAEIPGKERLHFLGFRKDVLEVVASCDLAANVSWTEAFSKTLFEAVFLDIPCVATAVSGNLELINNQDHGWQVPVKDPSAIAEAVDQAFRQPEERRRRAANARKYFEKNFQPEDTARGLYQWYQEILRS